MVAEKQFILDGCGVKYIPNRGPWTHDGPCTRESLGTVPSLLVLFTLCIALLSYM